MTGYTVVMGHTVENSNVAVAKEELTGSAEIF